MMQMKRPEVYELWSNKITEKWRVTRRYPPETGATWLPQLIAEYNSESAARQSYNQLISDEKADLAWELEVAIQL